MKVKIGYSAKKAVVSVCDAQTLYTVLTLAPHAVHKNNGFLALRGF